MALTERLALLVTLDAKGAVQGLNNVGRTAEQQLGKAEGSMAKFGTSAARAGVGMVAAGAVIGGALFKAAQASEDAEAGVRKLENSIQNSAKLAGHTADEFTDLAKAIQNKTAADADSIVAGQAVLAQLGLEADEIKTLTPLVVDLARKKGIDLVTAFNTVGKAALGNQGALKRVGVVVDETAFKTDKFAAITDALSNSVGGFAEQEGKTFAGSLERLKNQMGDIVEGVGGGAVSAFTDLLGPVQKAATAFSELDPQVQSSVGRLGTFGAVGLIAVGGAATVVGKVLSMRESFKTLGDELPRTSRALSVAGKALGGLAAGVAIFETVQIAKSFNSLEVDINEFSAAIENADDATTKSAQNTIQALANIGKLGDVVEAAATQNVVGAERLVEFAEAAGITGTELDKLRGIVETKRAADAAGARDQEIYSNEVDEASTSVQGLTDSLNDQLIALNALTQATLASFDSNLAYRNSIDGTQERLAEFQELQRSGTATAEELDDALRSLEGAMLDQAGAAAKNAEDQQKAAGGWSAGELGTSAFRTELGKLAASVAPGSELRTRLDAYIAQLDKAAGERTAVLNLKINAAQNAGAAVIAAAGLPKRAKGGEVKAGRAYLVGEEGPEPFIPRTSGTILPNSSLAHGAASSISIGDINVHVGPGVNGTRIGVDVLHEIRREVRRQGGDVQRVLGAA